jgi:ubiquinone/menaquinone biosynthesis C-methylase UbiE
MAAGDRWAQWLVHDRHGGDPAARERALAHLAPIRDRVIEGAGLRGSETLLDLGCGEGLIGFAALEALPRGRVIFSDISSQLVEGCRALAGELGLEKRSDFLVASADDLGALGDGSVDVVTARSVLIYLDRRGKSRALAEARRVLRPGGRLSIFEPINRFSFPEPPGVLYGYDVTAIDRIATKLKVAMERSAEEATLLDFDERDLFRWAEAAGFSTVRLVLEAEQTAKPRAITDDWDTLLKTSGNPLSPTFGETIEAALDEDEAAALERHLRPLVEGGEGSNRFAYAYLTALR